MFSCRSSSEAVFVSHCVPTAMIKEQSRIEVACSGGCWSCARCFVVAECGLRGQKTKRQNKNQEPAACFACCNDNGQANVERC